MRESGAVLYAEVDGQGPRLVLVHGFAQNRLCWGMVADALATDHEVVRIDAPGHGRSAACSADLWTGAQLIADVGGPGTYLGYSMGARFVLHLTVAHPELVRAAVLVGGTAGIADDEERAERVARDELMAQRLERDGIAAFLDSWFGQPLFAGLSDAMQFRAARRENTVAGLADSLRRAGTGSQEPLWDRLADIEVPMLLVAGADDGKFAAAATRMASAIGAIARAELLPGAGHAAHLEQPDAFLALVRPWLASHSGGG